MFGLFDPLTDVELLELEALLGAGSDGLVELDGFLHGVLCLPRMLAPSEWLEAALPESVAATEEKANHALGLTFRYYNNIISTLQDDAPVPRLDGSFEQAWTWLKGFARGFADEQNALQELGDAEARQQDRDGLMRIAPLIMVFALDEEDAPSGEAGEIFLQLKKNTKAMLMQQTAQENLELVTDVVRSVYNLLEPARKKQVQKTLLDDGNTYVREKPKIGRNEPCHCGSGKKYKHCHGKK